MFGDATFLRQRDKPWNLDAVLGWPVADTVNETWTNDDRANAFLLEGEDVLRLEAAE